MDEGEGGWENEDEESGKGKALISEKVNGREVLHSQPPPQLYCNVEENSLLTPAFAPSLVKTVETSEDWARLGNSPSWADRSKFCCDT